MGQTLISRQTLAQRWDYESTKPIEALEKEGVLTRVPTISSPRYSLDEIVKIETSGQDINPLSPLERRRLENKIGKLQKEVELYKEKIDSMKTLLIL
ncbi:transcription factor [Clostridium sp. HBUAS56017]|uniref:transcription factor n=1 Tax=Clostridium sp. HBUAS56017 TaxID=2571128 RepID=UPI0011789103|nr:transcription factor [Clostridium sp. HBUAS56017]